MKKTGLEHYSDKKLYQELVFYNEQGKDFVKSKDNLLIINSDQYIKGVFNNSFLLTERFLSFYQSNEWKFKKLQIDQYCINNLHEIANKASELERQYGKEKTDYYTSTFFNWEDTYATCRQFCIDLSCLDNIASELEKRYFNNGKQVEKLVKPTHIALRTFKYIADKVIDKIKF